MKFRSTVSLEEGAELLKKGEVVGLPSETVYGLAASIFNEDALRKVFSTKARPFFDPLIVHVNQLSQAKELCREWSPLHDFLAKNFWPGPLTLIAPKNEKVSDLITSGLDTVALRWPSHPLFQKAIDLVGTPLAAPSANKFGKTSPTTAQHVMQEFEHSVAVVEGGSATIGVESSVVLPLFIEGVYKLEILRPGGVTREALEEKLKSFSSPVEILTNQRQNSPGHLKHHYQPNKPLLIFQAFPTREEALTFIKQKAGTQSSTWVEMKLAADPLVCARELYRDLRQISDSDSCTALYIIREPSQSGHLWAAVWDRLEKASTEICNYPSTGF